MDIELAIKKAKLRFHLWWEHLRYEDPDEDPTILTRRPKNAPLISLRNEEYAEYVIKENEVANNEKELMREPLKDITAEEYDDDDEELEEEKKEEDVTIGDTVRALLHILDYGDGKPMREIEAVAINEQVEDKENMNPARRKHLSWLRRSLTMHISSQRPTSRMTLDSKPLQSVKEIFTVPIREEREVGMLSAMEIPELILSHSKIESMNYKIDALKDKISNALSTTAPSFGFWANTRASTRFPISKRNQIKSSMNEISMEAAMIASGNKVKK